MTHPKNFEAGLLPYPSDPKEIALAECSWRVIWRAYPYLEERFGERGKRFAASDTGYLVVLAGLDASVVVDQVLWLAGVLAPRGLPSWLLECQLRHLSRSGQRRGWPGAATMQVAEQRLRELRESRMPPVVLEAVAQRLRELLPDLRPGEVRGLTQLLGSAFADVGNGFCDSTTPLVDWLRQRTALSSGLDAVSADLQRATEVSGKGGSRC